MNRKSLFVTSALAAVTLLGGFVRAYAADVDPDQPQQTQNAGGQSDNQDTSLDQVVVSVTKRNEAIQDVPVAVTAYSSEQRDLLGVVSIFDFTRATPSFEYTTSLDRAFIRGVGRNTNAPGTQAGVALYIDGVYTSSTYGLDRAPILSGTYEADAGPQGTLFGRNSIGGVLQQNSAHAKDQFEIQADIRYNDHNRTDEAFSIGGPINEHVKVLLGLDYRKQTKGYFHNLALPNQDTAGPTVERLYMGIADYKFGKVDGFVKVEFNGFNRKLSQYSQYGSSYLNLGIRNNDYSTSATALSTNQFFNCAATDLPAGNINRRALTSCPNNVAQALTYYDPTNPTALNSYNINVDYRTAAKSHNNWTAVDQTTWHLPWFDLKYIGGYTQYIYDNHQDGDGTARGAFRYDPDGPANALPALTLFPQVINYFENRKWSSHEFDFTSNGDGPLSWIVGLYYYHDDFLNRYTQSAPQQTELSDTPGIVNPDRNYVYLNYDAITESKAVFAQVDYKFTPKLTLTAGIRYNRDDVRTVETDHYYYFQPGINPYSVALGRYLAIDSTSAIAATCATPAGVPTIASFGANCFTDPASNTRYLSNGWDGYGGTLNLSYKPDEDTLMYAKYSRGYKAGGIVSSSMAAQPILEPENLNAYEVGYKFSPSRKLTLNATAYYYDYNNYQDFGSVRNENAPSGFSTIGFNVPKSRNYGAELTALWHPTPNFTVTMTGNYMNAKVTDGGTVRLVDNLDPEAKGTVTLTDANGNVVRTVTYAPQPCGGTSPTTVNVAGQTRVVNRQPQCITGVDLKGSSPWKIWITPDYRFDFDKGSLDLIASYSWRAGNVSNYFKNPLYEAPAYDEADFRFVWSGAGKRYQIIGFVNNIFDKRGTEFVLPAVNTTTQQSYIQNVLTIPRTWGIELQARF